MTHLSEPTHVDDGTDETVFLSHAQMQAYQERGLVSPLSRLITDFVTYDGKWWIADREGWTLIEDEQLIGKLNNHNTWARGGLYLGGQ
jgi:hypothetical protein